MTTTTQDPAIIKIATDLVEHCKAGDDSMDYTAHDTKLWDKHYADGWTSIEGDGTVSTGRDEVGAKYKKWQESTTVHGVEIEGPFIGPRGFSVIFEIDMEPKDGSFPRMKAKEIADYTVENGKIVKEEFRFPPMPGEDAC